MRLFNLLTLVLLIAGGLNWGLVGVAQCDLVATLAGGAETLTARVVYGLIALSAVWQIFPLVTGQPVYPEGAPS